jgi:CheY-like chemotaxis protein
MDRARSYVLVVDDIPDAADSLADLIDLWGYHAEAHYGGPSALAAARRRPPAVVVLDIAMPRMDGFDLAVRLRELPGCARTSLIAVSGRTGDDSQARCCRLRIGHYLFKPVDSDVMRSLLANLVTDSEAANGRTGLPVTPDPETCGPESCDFLRKLSPARAWAIRRLRAGT